MKKKTVKITGRKTAGKKKIVKKTYSTGNKSGRKNVLRSTKN